MKPNIFGTEIRMSGLGGDPALAEAMQRDLEERARRVNEIRERALYLNAKGELTPEERAEIDALCPPIEDDGYCETCGQPLWDPRRDVVLVRDGDPIDRFGPFENGDAALRWRNSNFHCFDGDLQIVPHGEIVDG